uniref:BLTX504 n=1 Tax=Nephila pilipes TaxID=299642 RepID=A0A076KZS1_NEPPI|nr:BLTX504 [Nephila pilipes]
MHMTARFRYTSFDDFQALELPYKEKTSACSFYCQRTGWTSGP